MNRLIKVLFLPNLFYGGVVWLNQRNIGTINNLWYKILKTTVGATLNVKAAKLEIITGLLPILLQNSINTVKHYLKCNLTPDMDDPLKDEISKFNSSNACNILQELDILKYSNF